MLKSVGSRILLTIPAILITGCVSVPPSPASTITGPSLPAFTSMATFPTRRAAGMALNFEKVVALELPDSFINTLIFSPNGSTMITGDRNGEKVYRFGPSRDQPER